MWDRWGGTLASSIDGRPLLVKMSRTDLLSLTTSQCKTRLYLVSLVAPLRAPFWLVEPAAGWWWWWWWCGWLRPSECCRAVPTATPAGLRARSNDWVWPLPLVAMVTWSFPSWPWASRWWGLAEKEGSSDIPDLDGRVSLKQKYQVCVEMTPRTCRVYSLNI